MAFELYLVRVKVSQNAKYLGLISFESCCPHRRIHTGPFAEPRLSFVNDQHQSKETVKARVSSSCVDSLLELLMGNSFTLSLPAQNLPVSQILPAIDSFRPSGLIPRTISSEHICFCF